MKILLANAPWDKPGFYGVRAGSRWPHFENENCQYMPFPFFLAYSTALLQKNNFDVMLIDAIAEGISENDFFKRVMEFKPDIILFEVSTASILQDLTIAQKTRELFTDVKIIFSGAHKQMYEKKFLKENKNIDYVLTGEYELTLLALMQALKNNKNPNSIAGILFKTDTGEIIKNPSGPLEKNLERYPWPARQFLPMHKYVDTPGDIPLPSLQLWASRGCPFNCIFCSWPQIIYGGSLYRTRDPKDVVDELEWCIKEYGFKSFYFDDDTFNIGKTRILALAREIKDRKINLPWAIMARADIMDRQMLTALKEAGLCALKYGVESGSQQLINSACKSLDLQKVKESIQITRELGIKFHLTFMFGLPGETWDTVRQTIDFALKADPDSLQWSIATPFPGSRFYEMLEQKGYLLSKDFNDYDGSHRAVIRTEALSADDLEKALRLANKKWAIHQIVKTVKLQKKDSFFYAIKHPFRVLRRLAKDFL